MRIEIFASGDGSVVQMQSSLNNLHSDICATIQSLQNVNTKINNINGGVQRLADAVNGIQERIRTENAKKISLEAVSKQAENFLNNTAQTDSMVAKKVIQNTDNFFNKYTWLRPATPKEKSWWQQCVDDWNNFWGSIDDILASAWEGIKDFYITNKKVIDTILIVASTALSVGAVIVTGGLALVPLLGLVVPAGVATTISMGIATVAVVSTVAASTLNLIDTWIEVDNPIFNGWQTAMNRTSGFTNGLYSVGMLFNSVCGISGKEIATFKNHSYSVAEIRAAVKQDFVIKWKVSAVDSMGNAAKGNYGEMITDKAMREKGYKRVSNSIVTGLEDAGHRGIDGVYTNGSSYIVGEAKYGSSTLKMTSDGLQMSDSWINSRLDKAVEKSILDDIFLKDYTSTLVQVSKENPFTLNFSQLDSFAKVIDGGRSSLVLNIPHFTLPTLNILNNTLTLQ